MSYAYANEIVKRSLPAQIFGSSIDILVLEKRASSAANAVFQSITQANIEGAILKNSGCIVRSAAPAHSNFIVRLVIQENRCRSDHLFRVAIRIGVVIDTGVGLPMKRSHSFANEDAFLAAVTKVYDAGWADYDRTWKERDDLQSEEWNQFTTAVKPGGSVLDVGCNSGRDTRQLIDLGYRVTGLDVSEQALRLCREQCPEARTIKMSLLDLAGLKEQFDGIWFSYVLVHIPFKLVPEALAILDSVLHPEGSMMMMVTVVEESQEKIHNSNVMWDEHGVPRKVPVAHWAPEPLIALFRSRFEITWQNLRPFVDGWAQLSLLLRSRRSPAGHQEH